MWAEWKAVFECISGSGITNAYLREQKDNIYYPQNENVLQHVQKQVTDISEAIGNNPLPEKMTTYRSTTDNFLAMLLKQNGLDKAVNQDNSVMSRYLLEPARYFALTLRSSSECWMTIRQTIW